VKSVSSKPLPVKESSGDTSVPKLAYGGPGH
jgi:hypothetical protein